MKNGPDAVAVTEYVRSLLVERLKERGASRELARELGVTPAAVSQIIVGKNLVGPRIEAGFARIFTGGSIDTLRKQARKWWAAQPVPLSNASGVRVVFDERYPNRAKASEAARMIGLDPQAIAAVSAWSLKSEEDPDAVWWLDQMRGEHNRLRFSPGLQGVAVSADEAEAARPGGPRPKRGG